MMSYNISNHLEKSSLKCIEKKGGVSYLVQQKHKHIFYIGVVSITQVTQMRNKNSNIQGRSLNVIKVIFHTIRKCSSTIFQLNRDGSSWVEPVLS